jgi:hypothetical protein
VAEPVKVGEVVEQIREEVLGRDALFPDGFMPERFLPLDPEQ